MPFDQIRLEKNDGVAVLGLASGKLNAITSGFLTEAGTALEEIRGDDSVTAMVLTGHDSRFFSFGLDVGSLLPLDREAMGKVLENLNRLLETLFLFPKPVVAAVNGHAMAGGVLLALAADHRVGAEGKFTIGLSEVRLGLAAPAGALRMIARRIGFPEANVLAATGVNYDPVQALEHGLFHELVPVASVLTRARERAQELGNLPLEGFALNKQALGEGVFDQDAGLLEKENEAWLDVWFHPKAQARLKTLMRS